MSRDAKESSVKRIDHGLKKREKVKEQLTGRNPIVSIGPVEPEPKAYPRLLIIR
jgi:hypothetical protein